MKYRLLIITLFIYSQVISQIIVSPVNATDLEYLAAKEVRRYLYLRTGELLTVEQFYRRITDVALDMCRLAGCAGRLRGQFFERGRLSPAGRNELDSSRLVLPEV